MKRQRQVFAAFENYACQSRIKKEKKANANAHLQRELVVKAYGALKRHYLEMKRIKRDKILWQAHSTNEQFFAVGVTMRSQMDKARPEIARTNEDLKLVKKGMIEIKLI